MLTFFKYRAFRVIVLQVHLHVCKIRRLGIAFWIPKATNTCSEYVLLFHCSNGCTNAHHCYVFTYIILLERPSDGVNLAAVIEQTKFPLL